MKILLFCHLGLIREYAEYVAALRSVEPIETLLLTMGREESELAREAGVFDEVKNILPQESQLDAAEEDRPRTEHALRELERRVGYEFVNEDILMDRHFSGRPRLDIDQISMPVIWNDSRAKKFMYEVYSQLDQELRHFDPDFMFVETSFAPTRLAWRLASLRGVPAGGFMSVRFWPERMYLETGIGYDWRDARACYEALRNEPMRAAELEEVSERYARFIEEKTKPAYLQTAHAKGAPGFMRRLAAMLTYSGPGRWLASDAGTARRNPRVLPRKTFSPAAKLARYRKGERAKHYLRRHQTSFNELKNWKYAVYFLHVAPEITVEGMAFDYQDQESTLRSILARLPSDMCLVVKEHAPMLGYRSPEAYAKLAHMPGLYFAEHNEDSHRLITHSSVVVTLTGTVALEAMLYGVPAIVLGSIYFDSFNGIYKPQNLQELGALLRDPNALSGASEEDAIRALGSLRRASVPGTPARVDVSLGSIDPASAKSMMSELRRVCQRQ